MLTRDTETNSVETLLSNWNGMYVVGYILAAKPEGRTLTSDRYILQSIFRKLKEEATEAEATLLSDFIFATRDIFPFSRDLERALTHLGLGGLLIAENPKFVRFSVERNEGDNIIRRASTILSDELIAAQEHLAEKFWRYLDAWEEEEGLNQQQ